MTALFNILHANDTLKKILPQLTVIGNLDPATEIEVVKAAEDEDELQERRDALPDSELVVNLAEFESLAMELLGEDSRPWRYFSSWSDDGAGISAFQLACGESADLPIHAQQSARPPSRSPSCASFRA